jgi:hypothetical protein
MRKIRAIDIPEDLIQQLAARLRVDGDLAADLLAHQCSLVADAVVDWDAERHFDYLRRIIALGRFDEYRNLPPRLRRPHKETGEMQS